MPTCVGCDQRIVDQYLLRVAPDLEWHAACLKCADCGQPLDETRTCFVRDGKTYCRQDYHSRFVSKCVACGVQFVRNDLVMRARDRIYHVECFRCAVCERPLSCGDEFAMTPDDMLCCRADIDVVAGATSSRCTSGSGNNTKPMADDAVSLEDEVIVRTDKSSGRSLSNNNNNNNNDDELKTNFLDGDHVNTVTVQSNSGNGTGKNGGNENRRVSGGSRSHKSSDQKTTRIRTVLNEKQLHTLRTCYGANPRPDALMKEQLVEMTGLSPRVIRVWFQNKRCKDKKRSILLKQIQQHHQDAAVSMVAASPIRHEQQSSHAPVSVHQYQLLSWPNFLSGNATGVVGDQTTASLPPNCAQYGSGFHQHGGIHSSSHQHQLQQMHDAIELQQPPPFQRLLNSFGNLSSLSNDDDADDDDDGVVSLPAEETVPTRQRGQPGNRVGHGQFVIGGGGGGGSERRHKTAMMIDGGVMDMQNAYGSGVHVTSSSAAAAAAAAILSAASSSFGAMSNQHAVRC